MRLLFLIVVALVVGVLTASMSSCTTITETLPDGRVRTTKSADPAAVNIAGQALGAYVAIKAPARQAVERSGK